MQMPTKKKEGLTGTQKLARIRKVYSINSDRGRSVKSCERERCSLPNSGNALLTRRQRIDRDFDRIQKMLRKDSVDPEMGSKLIQTSDALTSKELSQNPSQKESIHATLRKKFSKKPSHGASNSFIPTLTHKEDFGKKVTCAYATNEEDYGCKIKEHDELARLPNFIGQALENLENSLDSLNVDKKGTKKKANLSSSRTRSKNRFGSIDPIIRSNKKGKPNRIFFRKEKLKIQGRELVKATEQVQARISSVQRRVREDYMTMKKDLTKKCKDLKKEYDYMKRKNTKLEKRKNAQSEEFNKKITELKKANIASTQQLQDTKCAIKKLQKENAYLSDIDSHLKQICDVIDQHNAEMYSTDREYKAFFDKKGNCHRSEVLHKLFEVMKNKIHQERVAKEAALGELEKTKTQHVTNFNGFGNQKFSGPDESAEKPINYSINPEEFENGIDIYLNPSRISVEQFEKVNPEIIQTEEDCKKFFESQFNSRGQTEE
ncbi:unnamed protein product [Moneuplotes crassus]|uniref:Uncharacterized protein n=1 Tax=Euplotes crassus TaxID=5936 RepID=A0AAD1X7H4_EUPCR|nr:unnamed protein product [Moneuplotes crassus]